jgi:hypothetical protein
MKSFSITLIVLLYTTILRAQFVPEQIIHDQAGTSSVVYSIDLDADNDMDVLSALTEKNQIVWFENLGGGSFATEKIISGEVAAPADLIAADLDGDNDPDILSANMGDSTISWFENLGGGTFSVQIIITNQAIGANSVFAMDLDGDSDMEILSTSRLDNKLAWYENLGSGNFGPQQMISANNDLFGPFKVLSADLSGDNKPDVLVGDMNGNITWYENLGGGLFGDAQVIGWLFYLSDVCVGDLDNDGDFDVTACNAGSQVALFENLGNGTLGGGQVFTSDANKITLVDLDGDQLLDILSGENNDTCYVVWYKNMGVLSFSAPNVIGIASPSGIGYPTAVHSADLDNDGKMDVLSAFPNKIVWYKNSTVTSVPAHDFSINMDVYPNPSSAYFTLRPDFSLSEINKILLTDIQGQIAHTAIQKQGDQLILDMRGNAAGTYLLTLYFDNRVLVKKLILLPQK